MMGIVKRRTPPPPLFPLKREFEAALDNYVQQSGMLRDAVESLIKADQIKPAALDIIKERVAAFDAACYGHVSEKGQDDD